MWPFSRGKRTTGWPLSQPLYHWSKADAWTVGDACLGTQIWGSTGSGKSTGSLAAITRSFLRAGFGGIFLTAKPEDRDVYLRYCRQEKRLGDVVLFGPQHPHAYNFVDAELSRTDGGGGIVENLTTLLATILELNERKGGDGREDGGYWRKATLQLSHEAISLLVLAKGKVTIPDLYRLVVSAPTSVEQLRSDEWRRGSFCWECLAEADARPKNARQQADFELTTSFFMVEWVGLSEKTRSVILSSFSGMVHALNRGIARDLLSARTTVTPEMTQEGAIILLDMPVKVYGEVGRLVQVIFKYCFQLAQSAGASPRILVRLFWFATKVICLRSPPTRYFKRRPAARVRAWFTRRNRSRITSPRSAATGRSRRCIACLAICRTKSFTSKPMCGRTHTRPT